MKSLKEELKEGGQALGYVGGELHEVFKNGLGLEDVKSIIDLAKNFPILKEGFDFDGKISKEELSKLSQTDMVEIIMATFSGFTKGKE